MMGLEPHIWSNVMTVLLVLGAIFVTRVVRGQRLWREAAQALWQRRRFALVVVAVYVLIGLADSVAWKGGVPEGAMGVLPNAPLSLLAKIESHIIPQWVQNGAKRLPNQV